MVGSVGSVFGLWGPTERHSPPRICVGHSCGSCSGSHSLSTGAIESRRRMAVSTCSVCGRRALCVLPEKAMLSPGMTIGVQPNVLWPASWAYPGTCDVPETMCAGAISITVDANYPCDTRDTAAVEACMQPQAIILAPTKISSCPGTSAFLAAPPDAERHPRAQV